VLAPQHAQRLRQQAAGIGIELVVLQVDAGARAVVGDDRRRRAGKRGAALVLGERGGV
jgi:hypothetical protein